MVEFFQKGWAFTAKAGIICLANFFLLGSVKADIIVTTQFSTTSQSAFDANISNSDLLQTSAFSTIIDNGYVSLTDLGSSIDGIRDGEGSPTTGYSADLSSDLYYDNQGFGPNAYGLNENPYIIAVFNTDPLTGGSALGYTITGINSFYGWHDRASLSNQSYTIAVAALGDDFSDPLSFTDIITVYFAPFDPADDNLSDQMSATEVSLTNINLSGIGAIKFTFSPSSSGQLGQVIRELDVYGIATIPEPSSALLMGAAVVVLALIQRIGMFRPSRI